MCKRFSIPSVSLMYLAAIAVTSVRADEHGSAPSTPTVDFERHVVPLLLKHGCSAGSCHGAAEGQAGFRLSLFSFDPALDYQAITASGTGRVDRDDPSKSLLLTKPSQIVDHEGGRKFAIDSPDFQLLSNWIKQGAIHQPGSGQIDGLELSPSPVILTHEQPTAKLQVFATYSNGDREDVTHFVDFRIHEDSVAAIDANHVLHRGRAGDTVIVAVYSGRPVSTRVLSPWPGPRVARDNKSGNLVDQHVESRLDQLNITPVPICDDAIFLRRLMLTTTGQLPTPDQIREFLRDDRPDKRQRAIAAQLRDPLHSALWATRMCEITGSRDVASSEFNAVSHREEKWHAWFRARFQRNAAFDEVVRGILTATTRETGSADEFLDGSIKAAQQNLLNDATRYSSRNSLDLFWQRPTVNEEVAIESIAERIAAAFLGVRIECARCHKHPFDRWTQSDHRSFVNIFSQVRYGLAGDLRMALADQLERQRELARTGQPTSRIPAVRELFISENVHDLTDRTSDSVLPPRPLGGPVLVSTGDRRDQFARWLLASENPFFARNAVNRVWSVCFGRGLVEPVDAFSDAVPPTHPEMLDALAKEFVTSGYNLRTLQATILGSDTWQRSSAFGTDPQKSGSYSRFSVRVLPADVLVDAISTAVGDLQSRAVEEPKFASGNETIQTYFQTFSRPERKLTCDCERSSEPTLRQAMLLLSDANLRKRIVAANADLHVDENHSIDQIIDELFLRSLSRWPNDVERQAGRKTIEGSGDLNTAVAEILWSLINTREFVTLH